MKLKPFFTYFGGKYRVAEKYPKPRYETIIEPFAGAAGYSIRHHDIGIHLFDINTKVVGTWKYLINSLEEDIRNLPLEFDDVRKLPISQEGKWLIGWWLNKGTVQPCNLPGKWMRDKTRPNSFWGEVIRERIASQLEAIRHWRVDNIPYYKLGNVEATWFIDPPYQRSGTKYTNGSKDICYERLGEWVRSRKGQVICCEQEGADWLPFRPFREIKGTEGKNMSGTSKETIWTN